MSSSGQSPFLHCLQQLNDDAWTQVLLPKLIEQGSAADVALTCSQLRDLCNHNVETIDLKALAEEEDVRDFDRWLQPLPAHYPNCKSAELSLKGDSSYVGMLYILPALARWVQSRFLSLWHWAILAACRIHSMVAVCTLQRCWCQHVFQPFSNTVLRLHNHQHIALMLAPNRLESSR